MTVQGTISTVLAVVCAVSCLSWRFEKSQNDQLKSEIAVWDTKCKQLTAANEAMEKENADLRASQENLVMAVGKWQEEYENISTTYLDTLSAIKDVESTDEAVHNAMSADVPSAIWGLLFPSVSSTGNGSSH